MASAPILERRIQAAQAALLLGITPRGVQAMAANGKIPGARKVGRVWTFNERALKAWIRRGRPEPCAEEDRAIARASGPDRVALLIERISNLTFTPSHALNQRIRNSIRRSLSQGKGGRSWQSLVGYTLDELRLHLEARFSDGMSWDNAGLWHIDHKRPLASFKITGPDCPEFRAAWALSNLQPLWGPDNLKKGAKWTP